MKVATKQAKEDGPLYPSAPSTTPAYETFEGNFSPRNNTTRIAIFSDDGCDVYIDGENVHQGKGRGQALPNLTQSLHKIDYSFKSGKIYRIRVEYSNTHYLGAADVDGATLFAYSAVVHPELKITTLDLPVGRVGQPYDLQFESTGGSGKLLWVASVDNLLSGLDLDGISRVVGTPTESGVCTITAYVKDSTGQSDTKTYTLKVEGTIPQSIEAAPNVQESNEDFPGKISVGQEHLTGRYITANYLSDFGATPLLIQGGSVVSRWVPVFADLNAETVDKIINNLQNGKQSGFLPFGKGNNSWFTSSGNPYVGISDAQKGTIRVEGLVKLSSNRRVFTSADLERIFAEILNNSSEKANFSADFRDRWIKKGKVPDTTKFFKQLNYVWEHGAVGERMWRRIGNAISSHASMGEVILENSRFSRDPVTKAFKNGRFLIVPKAKDMRVKGGLVSLIDSLKAQGFASDAVDERIAAKEIAKRRNWGKVVRCVKWGGKVLIVVGVATDVYEVYRAKNKVKAVVTKVGGWAGAWAGATAAGIVFAPAEAAPGPGTVVHGAVIIGSGVVGYFVGSATTRKVYELVVE